MLLILAFNLLHLFIYVLLLVIIRLHVVDSSGIVCSCLPAALDFNGSVFISCAFVCALMHLVACVCFLYLIHAQMYM